MRSLQVWWCSSLGGSIVVCWIFSFSLLLFFFFFQAEDGIRDIGVTGVQTCALPICAGHVCIISDALPSS